MSKARRPSSPAEATSSRLAYLYILPALAFYLLFVLAPLAGTMGLSFFDWDGLNDATFVGLENFQRLIADPRLADSLAHAAVLVVFSALLPLGLGLVAAVALSRAHRWLRTPLRTVLFLPYVLPAVVVAMVWRWLYEPNSGPVNAALQSVGLGGLARPWLGDFDLALPAVGVASAWFVFPLAMVLFLAGIQRISPDLYDAARVDGAGVLQETRFVTIPSLRQEFLVVLVITLIGAFRNFDLVYNMTRGGPGTSTMVPSLVSFQRAFLEGDVGAAAALGTVIFFLLTILVAVIVARWRSA